MDDDECRRRFAAADHAYLATVRPDGTPHLVPVVHVLTGDEVVVAVDHKPKRTAALQRLVNITANPQVVFLVDEYAPDWDALWWVRADAVATVLSGGAEHERAVDQLQARYPQYRAVRPTGPVILATVHRWTGWSAGSTSAR